jgi:hypothetical protein
MTEKRHERSIVPGCTEAIKRPWRPRANRHNPGHNRLPKRLLQQFHVSGLCFPMHPRNFMIECSLPGGGGIAWLSMLFRLKVGKGDSNEDPDQNQE